MVYVKVLMPPRMGLITTPLGPTVKSHMHTFTHSHIHTMLTADAAAIAAPAAAPAHELCSFFPTDMTVGQ